MSDTPLSDVISAVASGQRPVADFHRAFLVASLGITAQGIPAEASGAYQVGATDRITMRIVTAPDGRQMVRAYADPEVFAQRYDYGMNALMTGRELLAMVLKVEDVEGVLVCSAATFHSIPIGRGEIPALLANHPTAKARAWWKLR